MIRSLKRCPWVDSMDSHCLSKLKLHSLPAVCPNWVTQASCALVSSSENMKTRGAKGIQEWRQEVLGRGPACSWCSLGVAYCHHQGFSCSILLAFYHKASVIWAGSPRREEEPVFPIQAPDETATARARGGSSPPTASVVFCEPLLSAGKSGSRAGRNIASCLPRWVFTKTGVMKVDPGRTLYTFLWAH